MRRSHRTPLAALVAAALLAAPGGALAADPSSDLPVASPPLLELPAAPVSEGRGEVLVEPVLSREEAIAIAKRLFDIPASLGDPNVSIQQSQETAVWGLTWQTPGKVREQTRIGVGVDAVTGEIVSYSRYTSGQEQPLELSVTRKEAQAKAREWFAKLVPAEARGSLREVENSLPVVYWSGAAYEFAWEQVQGGYALSGYGVRITIDARTGDMVEYTRTKWQKAAPVLPQTVLSREAAEAAYGSKVPMQLQYQRFTRPGTDEVEWRLVWAPIQEFPRMDQSGALLDYQGRPLDLERLTQRIPVPASDQPYQKPAAPLTQAEALAVAQKVIGLTAAPTYVNYDEQGDESKSRSWYFSWTLETDKPAERSVTIDADTGLLKSYYYWSDRVPFEKGEKAPVSLEQAQARAIEFVRTHRPDLAGSSQLLPDVDSYVRPLDDDYTPLDYYLQFQILRNGIPLGDQSFSVAIDARTGEVREFWAYYTDEGAQDAKLPAPTAAVTAEQAMQTFLTQQGLEAAWVSFWDYETGKQSEPVLIWQPARKLNIRSIDARTGAPLDYEGRDLIEAQRYPGDIQGHYAEREIELLWARGVFELQDGKFNPDQPVTADELSRWIILAGGLRPYFAYDFALAEAAGGGMGARAAAKSVNSAYFGAALQAGIILPEELAGLGDLQGPVSRELFSLWAVRAMGYGRIAQMEPRIEMAFADKAAIGAKYQNAVAILAGLGIVSGDQDGNFNPQANLSRADAAKILFAVSAEGR